MGELREETMTAAPTPKSCCDWCDWKGTFWRFVLILLAIAMDRYVLIPLEEHKQMKALQQDAEAQAVRQWKLDNGWRMVDGLPDLVPPSPEPPKREVK